MKSLLQIVDAIGAHTVKIYTEKKCEVESADQLGEGVIAPGGAKDLMSIFRAYLHITPSM